MKCSACNQKINEKEFYLQLSETKFIRIERDWMFKKYDCYNSNYQIHFCNINCLKRFLKENKK